MRTFYLNKRKNIYKNVNYSAIPAVKRMQYIPIDFKLVVLCMKKEKKSV